MQYLEELYKTEQLKYKTIATKELGEINVALSLQQVK